MKIRRSTEHGFTRGDFLKMSGAGLAGATLLGGAVSGGGIRGLMTDAAAAEAPGTAHCAANESWDNYPRTQGPIKPYRICTPLSLADVVATVREAEAAQKRVHAFGSRWSFSDCAMTGDYLIDTTHLNRELQTVQHALRPGQSSSQLYHVEAGITIRALYERLDGLVVDKTVTVNESDFDVDTGVDMRTGDRLVVYASGQIWAGVALTGNNGPQGWDNIDCDPKFPLPCSHPYALLGKLNGSYFYIGSEVDKVHTGGDSRLFLRINDDTPANGNGSFTAHIQVFRHANPLALETMGGASGQTLVGAISTGTHGGDKDMPPLADSVLAIHLVGAGGTQYWIEPSKSITNRARLKERVVPDVEMQNIIYNDDTFNACLVSLGCMGVIYAVVLRVSEPYDLVETTIPTTWQAFKESASTYLNDPNNRFLQVLLNPYTDSNNDNFCLVTTRRSEPAVAGPVKRDVQEAVEAAVTNMVFHGLSPESLGVLTFHGVLLGLLDPNVPTEEKLAQLVDGILTHTPGERPVLVAHYGNILRAQWPTGTLRGSSYSVMDLGYGQPIPSSQRGRSIELHFQSIDVNGRLGCADFIDALIAVVNASTQTFFTGYVSIRFTGATRASLGMQQWNQTCTVEISTLQGVQGLPELLNELFRMGFTRGGLPHWGQELDLGVQGHGSLYRQYAAWRRIYAKMSNNFTARTFENELSSRWNLTTPDTGGALETLVVDKTVTVNESDFDVDTGVDMRTGDRLVVYASGQIWAGVALTGNNGPQGWDNIDCDPKFPLPCSHPYALLGKLNGSYFYIGSEVDKVHTGGDSRLFLRINDDTPANGNGSFTAHIQVFRH